MIGNYLTFDFGDSFFRDRPVVDLVIEKMPVSISLGIWTTLLVYLISIPLGIAKAVRDGDRFDIWTSGVVIVGNAIPGFLFAVLLLVVFAGGSYLDWFPLRGLQSEEYLGLGFVGCATSAVCVGDYLWHMVLPITAMVIGGFATLTMLTKNSFLDQINQQYVVTARSKGLSEGRVLYGHVFRNAMLIVIAGFPSAFISILFTSSVLIEIIFSLDGLGLLGFEATFARDYPIMFGTLFFFSLLGLVMGLIGDLMYTVIDPRITFERVGA
jgi:microcin C transport system permease protein